MRKLILLLVPLFRPVYFWLGYGLFRSPFYRRQGRLHSFCMNLLRLAADLNHTRAQSVYGHLLHLHGDSQASKVQGGIFLERAANAGDMKAQYLTGRIYEHGYTAYFSPNPQQALHFYRLAAENGHIVAISRLVDVYENGELGQAADAQQAEDWHNRMPGH